MKHLLLPLFCLSSLFLQAQYSGSVSYALSAPQGDMAKNIKPVHSVQLAAMRQLPGCLSRIHLGIEGGIGTYAQLTRQQTFVFTDGSSTQTDVLYSSNVINGGLMSRVDLVQGKKITPYVTGKAGYAKFYSNINVQDPEDVDGCRPLERRSLIKDGTFTTAYGGGFKVDVTARRNKKKGIDFIDFSVTRVGGGSIDYINTKKLKDHYHSAADTDPKSRPLVQRFINVNSQAIHEHQVAEVYNSPLRLVEFRIGYTVSF
jgi:hypothetical protein